MALRVACVFAPAGPQSGLTETHKNRSLCPQPQPVFHTGQWQHVSTAGSLAPEAVKGRASVASINFIDI